LLDAAEDRPVGGRELDLDVGVFLVGEVRFDEAEVLREGVREGVDFPDDALELAVDRGGVPSGLCDAKALRDRSTDTVPKACRLCRALLVSLRTDDTDDLAELKFDRTLPVVDEPRELPGPGDGGTGSPDC